MRARRMILIMYSRLGSHGVSLYVSGGRKNPFRVTALLLLLLYCDGRRAFTSLVAVVVATLTAKSGDHSCCLPRLAAGGMSARARAHASPFCAILTWERRFDK